MGMCGQFAHMFKLAILMCSLKAFQLKSLSFWKISTIKPIALYILFTVLNYLMVFSALFEVQFSAVRKVVLDTFVWRKIIPLI